MKKILSLALATLMLLSILAGCNSENQETPPSATPSPSSTQPSTDPAYDNTLQEGVISLPLVAERQEFEIWSMALDSSIGIEDLNESNAYQRLEELTNIHINWKHPSQGDEVTNFNLVVASQDYPDAFQAPVSYFIGGLDKYIDDEIIIDISDIVERYCPNYDVVRKADDVVKGTVTDSGRMPGFFGIKKTVQPSWMGPTTRADWLQDLGLESPETMDEFYNMLVKYRDEKNCLAPLSINNNGLFQMISAAWGIGTGFYHVNGQVQFGPIQPEFKEYLELMRKWYSEGLIDPEFYTVAWGSRAYDTEYTLTGKVGVWNVAYNFIQTNLMLAADDPTYNLVAIPCPVFNVGDTREIALESYIQVDRFQTNIAAITTDCEDPVTLSRWFDYLYTEEGGILGSYGIENESFVFDAEGNPKFTELIYDNPEGFPAFNAMNRYAMSPNQSMLYDWERELLPNMHPVALEAPGIWDANYVDKRTLPTMMSISTDDSAEYASIINDVNTLINETVVKFIIGTEPLENYDSFVSKVKSIGIDRAIEIQQSALDLYNQR